MGKNVTLNAFHPDSAPIPALSISPPSLPGAGTIRRYPVGRAVTRRPSVPPGYRPGPVRGSLSVCQGRGTV